MDICVLPALVTADGNDAALDEATDAKDGGFELMPGATDWCGRPTDEEVLLPTSCGAKAPEEETALITPGGA